MFAILFVLFVYVAPLILFSVVYGLGRLTGSKFFKWIGGVPLAIWIGFGLFSLCGLAWDAWEMSHPENVYAMEFENKPPPEVTELSAAYDSFGDTAGTWLRFKAPSSVVKALAHSKKLARAPRQKFADRISTSDPDEPDWWLPHLTPQTQLFAFSGEGEDFMHEETYLLYDPRSKWVYYTFRGID